MSTTKLGLAIALVFTLALPINAHAARQGDSTGCWDPAANVNYDVPATFDPATASDADLACYGLPARPYGNPVALKVWQHFVGIGQPRVKIVHARLLRTNFRAAGPHSRPKASARTRSRVVSTFPHWAGYAIDPSSDPSVDALGYWTEPDGGDADGHLIVRWVGFTGVGGVGTAQTPLYQSGTAQVDPAISGQPVAHSFWYEEVCGCPNDTPVIFLDRTQKPLALNDFTVTEQYFGKKADGTPIVWFKLQNITQGVVAYEYVSIPSTASSTTSTPEVEYITEDASFNGNWLPFLDAEDYHQVDFELLQLTGSSGTTYALGAFGYPAYTYNLYDSTQYPRYLMEPVPVNNGFSSFNDCSGPFLQPGQAQCT